MHNKIITTFIVLFLMPVLLSAADIGTFQEFYSPDKSWGFWTWAILIGSVILFVGITIATFGSGAPAGSAIIGGALGLTGGTALAVGTAIIVGASEIAIQLTFDEVTAHFEYEKFKEDSKKMISLPVMNNPYGGGECKKVFKILSNLDKESRLDSGSNLEILENALAILDKSESAGIARYKENLIKSVILFQKGDYLSSKNIAKKMIDGKHIERTSLAMPYYLYAVSSFYDKDIDVDASVSALKKSIMAEPDNPILMLIYGIYMDRFTYLLAWNKISASHYYDVIDTISPIKDEKKQAMVLYVLYARCVGLIEKSSKEINIITNDTTFDTLKTEKILWQKCILKSDLEKIAAHIYFQFSKLKSDKEIADGMKEYSQKLDNLKKSNDFYVMLKYSFKKHILAIIILISAIAFVFYRILKRRKSTV